MKRFSVMVVLCAMLALVYAVPSLAEEDILLANVGGTKIRMSDFKRMTSYYDAEKKKLLEEQPQYRAIILLRIVQGMLVSQIAHNKGFDKRPDVKEQMELLSNDFLSSEYIRQEVIGKIAVTEDDMKLYYKTHQEEFTSPELVRVRLILVKVEKTDSDDTKKKARAHAEEILKKIKAGEDFADLAAKFSDDVATKTKGGDMGFIQKGKLDPKYEKDIFSLKAGEISNIIDTPFGYSIVKVEEKKAGVLQPFEQIKEKVKEKVVIDFRKKKVDQFINNAMEDAKVEVYPDKLLPQKESK